MTDDAFAEMKLGDLTVYGEPPAKLRQALAVVGAHLRPTISRFFEGGNSLGSCVLVSLVLRDYFYRLGFTDAEVRSVIFQINRRKREELVHSVGIGAVGQKDLPGHWGGHMILVLPKAGWMVDATLYQAKRDHWEDLPGMIATPTFDFTTTEGNQPMAGFATVADDDKEDVVRALWFDNSANNRWRNTPAARRGGRLERHRRLVSEALIEHFGKWRG